MNKTEFFNKLYETSPGRFSTKAQAAEMMDAVLDNLAKTLASGESVAFTGFGTFKIAKRAARQGRNPRTGAPVNIKASKSVKFSPGKALKELIN